MYPGQGQHPPHPQDPQQQPFYSGYNQYNAQPPQGHGAPQPNSPHTGYGPGPSVNTFHGQGYQQQGYYPQHGYGQQQDYHQGGGMGASHPPQSYQAGAAPDQAFAIPGLNAPGISPVGVLLNGSGFLSGGQTWGQRYMQGVQQKMGWLSGGALNYQFAISNQYIMNKLFILFVPFLKRWSFSRQAEQIQGSHKYRPPRMDVNAPDLYIPLVSAWTYVTLLCLNAMLVGKYKPDIVYSKVWYTGCAWGVHCIVAWVLLRMMSLPTSLPWSELIAYTGYVFVPACATLLVNMSGSKWAWWCAWAYGSLTSAVFLVRTIKRVLFQEARSYGPNLTLTNYLLLTLAAIQFPLLLWLCSVQQPTWLGHTATGQVKTALGSPPVMAVAKSPLATLRNLVSNSPSPAVVSKMAAPPIIKP